MQPLPRSLVDDLQPDDVPLDAPARHHLERVLRVRAGEALELVDGRGGRALARWTASGHARIEERFAAEPPTRDALVIAVAPPRLPRLEWLVEKACELDVTELQLLDTHRAERLPGEGRLDRLQRIADQALVQCRRLHRMPVRAPIALEALLARPRSGELWLAHPPRAGAPPTPAAAPERRRAGLLVLIGPEGGLDPEEEAAALAAGAAAVALGATTLRVETAALALAVLARGEPGRVADRHPIATMPRLMDSPEIRLLRSLATAGVRYVPRASTAPSPGRKPAARAATSKPAPAAQPVAPPSAIVSAPASLFAPQRTGEAEPELAAVAAGVVKCVACRLATTRNKAVPGEGDPHARVVFVGEGPGADEDRTGRPFVGRAGQLLDDIITKGMKLRREDVYIANVVKCRPPENRVPAPDEVEACADWLDRQLLAIAPRVICALGSTAARRLLQTERSLGALRGTTHRWRDFPVIVTYHPAYLLRNPAAKTPTWADIQRVIELMNGP